MLFNDIPVRISVDKCKDSNNISVILVHNKTNKHVANVTIDIPEIRTMPYCAIINSDAGYFLACNNLATIVASANAQPMCRFNREKLYDLDPKGCAKYEASLPENQQSYLLISQSEFKERRN